MRNLCWLLLVMGCGPGWKSSKGKVIDKDTPPSVDSDSPDDPIATDTGENVMDLVDTWWTCTGELSFDDDGGFVWNDLFDSCHIEGSAEVGLTDLTLVPASFDDCSDGPPWWLTLNDGAPVAFQAAIASDRLTLVPEVDVPSARVAQFARELTHEYWHMTDALRQESFFGLCSLPDGPFFSGFYTHLDDNCDFLSCSGSILSVEETDRGEHWITRCGGDCPCTGVLTVEDRTETSMAGRYHGSNCARTLSSTFTGVPYGSEP